MTADRCSRANAPPRRNGVRLSTKRRLPAARNAEPCRPPRPDPSRPTTRC